MNLTDLSTQRLNAITDQLRQNTGYEIDSGRITWHLSGSWRHVIDVWAPGGHYLRCWTTRHVSDVLNGRWPRR